MKIWPANFLGKISLFTDHFCLNCWRTLSACSGNSNWIDQNEIAGKIYKKKIKFEIILKTQKFTKSCPQDVQRQYSGPLNCATKIVRQNGWLGLYQGGSAMFWRDLIGYFFYIPAYEHFRYAFRRNNQLNENICEVVRKIQ